MLKTDVQLQLQHPSLRSTETSRNLYMQAPEALRIATTPNLDIPVWDLLLRAADDSHPKDICEEISVSDPALPAVNLRLTLSFSDDDLMV